MDSSQTLFRFIVWMLYFIGVGVHVLISARASIAAQSNSIHTLREWWAHNFGTLGFRLFLDSAALMIWESSPQLIGQFTGHAIPVTYGTAALMGLAIDRVIGSMGFSFGWGVDMPQVAPKDYTNSV